MTGNLKNVSQGSLANNSSERLSKTSEKAFSKTDLSITASPSELLAAELGAIKIKDSKEDLSEKSKEEGPVKYSSLASLKKDNLSNSKLSEKNLSNTKLSEGNNLSNSKLSEGNNLSDSKLSESNLSNSKLSENNNLSSSKLSENNNLSSSKLSEKNSIMSAVKKAYSISSNKSSADKLEAVSLNDPEVVTEKGASTVAVAENANESVPVDDEEAVKKSCVAEKAAKCRCVIS